VSSEYRLAFRVDERADYPSIILRRPRHHLQEVRLSEREEDRSSRVVMQDSLVYSFIISSLLRIPRTDSTAHVAFVRLTSFRLLPL
jgi:hypothetical protein